MQFNVDEMMKPFYGALFVVMCVANHQISTTYYTYFFFFPDPGFSSISL